MNMGSGCRRSDIFSFFIEYFDQNILNFSFDLYRQKYNVLNFGEKHQ